MRPRPRPGGKDIRCVRQSSDYRPRPPTHMAWTRGVAVSVVCEFLAVVSSFTFVLFLPETPSLQNVLQLMPKKVGVNANANPNATSPVLSHEAAAPPIDWCMRAGRGASYCTSKTSTANISPIASACGVLVHCPRVPHRHSPRAHNATHPAHTPTLSAHVLPLNGCAIVDKMLSLYPATRPSATQILREKFLANAPEPHE